MCTRRAPVNLWVPWEANIYSAGAYIIRRPAMRKILDTYLPGKTLQHFTWLTGNRNNQPIFAVHIAACVRPIALQTGLFKQGSVCSGAAESGQIKDVNLTAVSHNWDQPLACQSERVLYSAVRMSNHHCIIIIIIIIIIITRFSCLHETRCVCRQAAVKGYHISYPQLYSMCANRSCLVHEIHNAAASMLYTQRHGNMLRRCQHMSALISQLWRGLETVPWTRATAPSMTRLKPWCSSCCVSVALHLRSTSNCKSDHLFTWTFAYICGYVSALNKVQSMGQVGKRILLISGINFAERRSIEFHAAYDDIQPFCDSQSNEGILNTCSVQSERRACAIVITPATVLQK